MVPVLMFAPQIVGWIFTVLGLGLMWLMTADAPAGIWLGL